MEIAPYCTPVAPKGDGYKTIIMDVFDTAEIQARASGDATIDKSKIALIEEVDVVGDASDLAALTETARADREISYIVSSHNFEHLPNPIKFLVGCAEVLQDGGMLSMAIPDYRVCFDHFRYPTRLSDWLDAYHQPTTMPAPERIFEAFSVHAEYVDGDARHLAFNIEHAEPAQFEPLEGLKRCYDDYLSRLDGNFDYVDSHFSAMFDKTFELMVRDLIFLGVLDFEILEISETRGHEFFVHLRKSARPVVAAAQHQQIRAQLLKDIQYGLGAQAFRTVRAKQVLRLSELSLYTFFNPKSLVRTLVGKNTFGRLQAMNRARRQNRH